MANLQKHDPFGDLWNMSDEVGRLFWGLGHRDLGVDKSNLLNFVPALDVAEDDHALTLTAELPGLKKEDVKINVRDGVLTLSGEKKFEEEKKKDDYYRIERSYGNFARSFSLPNTMDHSQVSASMKDGVLKISIPKKPEAKEREINVDVH